MQGGILIKHCTLLTGRTNVSSENSNNSLTSGVRRDTVYELTKRYFSLDPFGNWHS